MAVVVRDLYFGYKSGLKSKSILNGINMNVNEGSIYALLGPSGCGKTTLLNIIIGLRKAKFGDVYLYGYKGCCKANGIPGSGLGYMPQDLGLQYDLTILEILNYFGNFAMLSASDIKKESLLMIKRFNLPGKHRLIGQLSGGQKRLVSLAVALLHKPRLLILDEPTVGVDPLLRATIWNYLLDLSAAECVTTIITTHYVDEAKRANIVAFMRKGEILCEGNPNQFLDTYNVSTLDDVLLTLCLGQGPRPQAIDMITDGDEDQPLTMKPFKIKNMNSFYSFYRITQSLIKKYMIESRRNPMTLIALFLFTFVSIVTAMLVFGSPMLDLKVAWVNDGVDPNFWINHFDEFGINNTLMNSTIFSSEIQLLLRDSMDPSVIKLIEFKSLPEALDSMEMFNIHGIIYLKSNFSDYYTLCDPFISDTFDIDCNENEIIANASITLYTDETNPILSDALKFTIGHSIQNFRLKVARLIGINEHRLRPPFEIELLSGDAINTNNYNFEHFTAPGFLVIAPFGFSAAICILTIITEKQTDMSIRNYASGVKPHHTVFAEIIAKFSFLLLSTLFNILCTIKFFDLPCRGSLLLVILLSALQVLLGITQGILFSSMFSKSMLSFLTCTFVLIGTLLTTGAIWSVESQPFIYQWINYLLPFAHSIKSMRCLLLKPNATFHPQISMGFIMSSFYTIFNTILSLLLLNFKQYFF